jgi:hypothetical protein
VNTVAVTPDGRFVISGSDDTTLRLCELDWELDTNETVLPVGEEATQSFSFVNRITSFFNNTKKK